jgi:phosphoribosylglycinamide formyltransferase-1
MSGTRKRVAVFISGGGSNMLALADAAAENDFPAEIVAVISDKGDAGGLQKAAERGIPAFCFERKDFDSKAAHEKAILDALAELSPDILCLAGYMRLLSADFIRFYEGRILNIHPSLLPLLPGLHTHKRAIEAGMKVSGCTVHLVTEGMDEGPILAQAAVPVLADDTPDTLAARILKQEHRIYRRVLEQFARGGLPGGTDEMQSVVSLG